MWTRARRLTDPNMPPTGFLDSLTGTDIRVFFQGPIHFLALPIDVRHRIYYFCCPEVIVCPLFIKRSNTIELEERTPYVSSYYGSGNTTSLDVLADLAERTPYVSSYYGSGNTASLDVLADLPDSATTSFDSQRRPQQR